MRVTLSKGLATAQGGAQTKADIERKIRIPNIYSFFKIASVEGAIVRNDKGESLVHQAVKKGDISRVKQLLDDGHSANTIDHNSWTPLHEVHIER